jgi:hypothetical protein
MTSKFQKADLSVLRELLPPFVPRNWKRWNDLIPISSRTIANEDSKGTGIKNRILVGNVCCYERDSLIEYLERKSRVISVEVKP